MPLTFNNKKPGDIVRSNEWNEMTNEVNAKLNRSGGAITGSLTVSNNLGVNVPTPSTKLHISGGNWNPTTSNGDLMIGDSTHRLKIGVATGGGGAGDVRIRAQGGTNRLIIGTGNSDTLYLQGDKVGINASQPEVPLQIAATQANDVKVEAVNSGALIIGLPTGSHMALDNNEIMAKSNGTTAGTLWLQADGGTLNFGHTSTPGTVNVRTGSVLNFGNQVRQMINLWSTSYGIGVQSSTQYYRSNNHFAWYKGGSHNDGALNAGGGTRMMHLNGSGDLRVNNAVLIHFRRYNNLGDNINVSTGFSASVWDAGICGFRALSVDINENGTGNFIQCYMFISAGVWRIRADLRSHNNSESWYVDVMFVNRKISSRNGF